MNPLLAFAIIPVPMTLALPATTAIAESAGFEVLPHRDLLGRDSPARLRSGATSTAIKYGDTVVKIFRKQDWREFNLMEREVCVLKLLRQTVYSPSMPVRFKPGWPVSTMFTRCASLRDRENPQDAAETVPSLSVDFHTVSASLGPPDCWGRRTQILQ